MGLDNFTEKLTLIIGLIYFIKNYLFQSGYNTVIKPSNE
jgi:hypothetical protein